MHVTKTLRVASFICFMFVVSVHGQLKAQTDPAIIRRLGEDPSRISYFSDESSPGTVPVIGTSFLAAGGLQFVGIKQTGEVGFHINNFGHVSFISTLQGYARLAHCRVENGSGFMAWSSNGQLCRNTTLRFAPGASVDLSNIFEYQHRPVLASALVSTQVKSAVPNSDRLYFCSAISETGGWGAAATTAPWDILSSDDPCKVAVSRCEANSNGANCTIENAGIKVIDSPNKVYTPAYSCDGKGFLELKQEEKFVPWQDLDTSLILKSQENHRSCVVSILDTFEYALSPTSDQATVVYAGEHFNSLPGFNFDNRGSLVMVLAGSVSITSPLYSRPVTLTDSAQVCGILGGSGIPPTGTGIIACNLVGESGVGEFQPAQTQIAETQVSQVKATQIYQDFFDQDAWGEGAQEPILGFEQAVDQQFIGFPVAVTPILDR